MRYVGEDELYGKPVSEYTLGVDLAKAFAVRDLVVPQRPPRKATYHLWFNQQHLLRKLSVRVSGIRASAEMSQWGKHVKVHAPATEDILGRDAV